MTMPVSIILEPNRINHDQGLSKTVPPKSVIAYEHVINALGGYESAKSTIRLRPGEVDLFLTHVLNTSFKSTTQEDEPIWEGFVNEAVVTYNGIDITIGPVMDIANRVLVRYTDFATGLSGTTVYGHSYLSQSRYGVLTKILAASQVSSTNAQNIRDHYIKENHLPAYNMSLTTQLPELTASVTLNCLGNVHHLSRYVYNSPLTTTTTVREKMIAVLAAHPSGLFNQTGLIHPNNLSVPSLENEDRLGIDIVKELVSMGSQTNNDRMVFGVYDNFSIVYQPVRSDVEIFYRSRNNGRFISNSSGGARSIASVKPGQYVAVNDLPDHLYADARSVPKYIFAESVTYTAPYGLSITGTNVSTLQQKLAKLGLSGI